MIEMAGKQDLSTLTDLALIMWSNHRRDDLEKEFASLIEKSDVAFFLIYEEKQPVGFAQCQLRHDYVEGTNSSPVGYLEGIFVKEEYRHRGYAKELLCECEKWSSFHGCIEFASDCELSNDESLKFHLSMGFEEVNRVICFAKKLSLAPWKTQEAIEGGRE